MRRLLATVVFATLAVSSAAADNPLLGSWRLVAAIPGSMEDSPNGVRNLRIRFGTDGKAVLVDPTETLASSTTRNKYSVEGNTLTLQVGDDKELHGAIEKLPGGEGFSITYLESGMTWSLRKIPDSAIETQTLAPESVQYIPPATLATVEAYKYDDGDDSALPVPQRLVGQWEVVEISGYGGGDFPPYGAPNEVWVFDGAQLTRHDNYHPDKPQASAYHVAGGLLVGEGGSIPFRFDEWQRLVIGEKDSEYTVLKRINRNPKGQVSMPPLRIILGYPRGAD